MRNTVGGQDVAVLLFSQLPLDVVGGGELFTLNCFRQLERTGSGSELWCLEKTAAGLHAHSDRRRMTCVRMACDNGGCRVVEKARFDALLSRIDAFDLVAVHQFLSNNLTIDLLSACAPDQRVVLTSLGHEAVADHFERVFEPASNHFVVEISSYAAQRAKRFRGGVHHVSAGIWAAEISPGSRFASSRRQPKTAVSVGRLLPHKGFEVTVSALPGDWQLAIVGPPSGDAAYENYLRGLAERNPAISITGCLSQVERNAKIAQSHALIASSCHTLYHGRTIEQAELFGLVLLEAVAAGTLPIASDIPSFSEVMETLGLGDWLYEERSPGALRAVLERLEHLPATDYDQIVANAQARLVDHYLWDTYWDRVLSVTPTAEAAPEWTAGRSCVPSS